MGKKIAIGGAIYLAIGAAVTVWTIIKQQKGEPSFDGIGATSDTASILVQNLVAWPYAAIVNLTKSGGGN